MERLDSERIDRTLLVTIRNPSKANAIDSAMGEHLQAVLTDADSDPSVRCVVIAGTGGYFCSGHDIDEVRADPHAAAARTHQLPFLRPAEISTPCIAAVDGPAVAAGFILALSCDIRVASERTTFGAPAAKVGLLPLGGQLSRLLFMLPHGVVMDMVLTGAPLSARDALSYGFVRDIAEEGDGVIQSALRLAATISEGSPGVIRAMKYVVRQSLTFSMENADEQAYELAGLAITDGDWREGLGVRDKAPRFPDRGRGVETYIAQHMNARLANAQLASRDGEAI